MPLSSMSETHVVKTKLQVTCPNCSLNRLCLPRGLKWQEVERISSLVSRRKTLQKGDYLYRKGDPFRGIIAVKSGSAKLVSLDRSGNEYLTGYLLPGELLGFDALSSDRHTSSAVALETLSYCVLPAEQLDALCVDIPNLLRQLFRHAGDTLTAETNQIILGKRPAEERVAGFLLNLSERLGRRGFSRTDFRLSLTRQEIGNYLGLALETVSRILAALEDAGLINVNNKHIHICDLPRLKSLYGSETRANPQQPSSLEACSAVE
jgi:CRP/FNR family transcriptional regulator, anaerobic regulatory protein